MSKKITELNKGEMAEVIGYVEFVEEAMKSIRMGKNEFFCPICSHVSAISLSGYNGHLRVKCGGCHVSFME